MAAESTDLWQGSFKFTFAAPVDKVWSITKDFLAMDKWAPSLIHKMELVEGESQKVGCVRKIVFPTPANSDAHAFFVLERLVEYDADNHKLKYNLEGGNLPFFEGLKEIKVEMCFQLEDAGDCSKLVWKYQTAPFPSMPADVYQQSTMGFMEGCCNELKNLL